MSVEIPVVAIAFGSVTPPQGDVIELRVHLGCTKEVSSFECLLQNFDKEYTVTNPINVGDNCSISIGRGANCPLILTGRVEEVEPESTPVENYIRVRGRCWGEKIFRRVVTETYENQKGEAVVKGLMDSYAGLSHNRPSDLTLDAAAGQKDCVVADGSKFVAGDKVKIEDDNNSEWNEVASVSGNTVTMVNNLAYTYTVAAHGKVTSELIEDTDTTYTLLEYKDTPVFDILKYIAESADKSGVIGFDFRIEHDGKFRFFPRNSKTSPISLSERIEHSRYSKDIHRVRNKIMVYGAVEKPYPLDIDGQPWSDSLTENLTKPDNYLQHDDGKWDPVTGNTNLYIATSPVHTGSKSVKAECTVYMYYMALAFTFNADKYVNCNKYPRLCFTLREDDAHNQKVTVSLEDKDGNTCRQVVNIAEYDEWQTYQLGIGKLNEESWSISVFNSGDFDWENLKEVRFDFHQKVSSYGVGFVDRMHFGGCRWNATEEDSASQSSYGLRELTETDEELHSDNECSLRAKALLNHLSQPAEFLTLRSGVIDYGMERLYPGDKIHVTLPNENVDSDYRITSVEYRVTARDQTLENTLELGKEKPLLADYLYGLRSTTVTLERLARTKAGLTSVAGGSGGGGGGGGADEKVKVSSTDTTTDYLIEKLLAGEGITLTKKNPEADEDLEIKSHRKWSWADEFSWIRKQPFPMYGEWTRQNNGDPIIPPHGSWDRVSYASAIWDDDEKVFYIWYSGRHSGNQKIGLAKFDPSTLSVTYLNNDNPVLASGTNFTQCWYPSVILDGDTYHMAFTGKTGTQWWNQSTFHAYSTDKINWTVSPETALLTLYAGPIWIRSGDAVFLYCRDFDSSRTSTYLKLCLFMGKGSTRYTSFTAYPNNPILDAGSAGEWDDSEVGDVGIFWNLGTWYLLYFGTRAAPNYHFKIGMCISPNGWDMVRYPWNPIVDLGESGKFDDTHVSPSSITFIEGKFHFFYSGHDGSGWVGIGYQTLE